MFAYCLNNPVVLVDTSGTAAHIGFSADGQIHDAPWRIGSPGGGGWPQDIHYSQQDYGSVAEKFYTVMALRFVGAQITHSAHKLWDAYVYSVERSADLCLQQNMEMLRFTQDLFSSPKRTLAFFGIIEGGIGAGQLLASSMIGSPVSFLGIEIVNPIVGTAIAVGALVIALAEIVWYFQEIP